MLLTKKHGVLAKVAVKGGSRPVLECVHLTPKYAEASDGRVLVRVPIGKNGGEKNFPPTPGAGKKKVTDALLPATALAEAIKSLPTRNYGPPELESVRVTANNGHLVLSTTDLDTSKDVAVKPAEGTFPQTDQLIPKRVKHGVKGTTHLCLALDVLAELLAVGKGLGADAICFQVERVKREVAKTQGSYSQAVRVEFLGDECGAVGVAMPIFRPREQPKPKRQAKQGTEGAVQGEAQPSDAEGAS